MPLEAGTRLGHYEILSSLGAGGMGEVYRAKDTKLGREVAIKLLLEEVSADPERLARFEREARLLASLNHNNIATLHGFEAEGDTHFLVMELVEGETLADRIKRGAIPVDQAIPLCLQIAEGLEAAHEKGVIHRDLKPANIKLTPQGVVKVLDFGLAKTVSSELPTAELGGTMDPTVAATREGVVLGTAPYMSPEQARGQPLDKRTDIWAFGCVLFEMLSRRSPFRGDTVTDTMVRVLDRDPDWEALPSETPARVQELLRRCLEKDPRRRCRDIGDARLELEEAARPAEPGSGASSSFRPGALAVMGAIVLIVAAALFLFSGGDAQEAIDSIVVLPFENAGTDPDGEYLSNGITENLINKLSTLPGLRVIPRGIAYGYRDRSVDLRTLGKELGVRAVVTGRVEERDGTLVVRAELTDLATLSQLWGEQYNRPLADILAIEEDLVRQISTELRVRISAADEIQLVQRDTDNPEAYQLFLKSRYHTLSNSPEGMELGMEYARQAVALDSEYGLGYAVLADAWAARALRGMEPLVSFEKARAAAERAVALDKTHAYPRLMMGFIKYLADWDWEGAMRDWELALELEPENGDAHQSYSAGLVSTGRLDEALVHALRAVELDPTFANFSNWLSLVYQFLGRQEEAFEANATALELAPRHGRALSSRPFLLAEMERDDEAIAALQELLESRGQNPAEHPALARLYARLGRLEEAREIVVSLSLDELPSGELLSFARASARLSDMDGAFEALDRASEARVPGLPSSWFPYLPANDVFKGDPRFDELARRMDFPQ